nr:MAG TPA: hypothetical protein [Caudoviricetes sp.]
MTLFLIIPAQITYRSSRSIGYFFYLNNTADTFK